MPHRLLPHQLWDARLPEGRFLVHNASSRAIEIDDGATLAGLRRIPGLEVTLHGRGDHAARVVPAAGAVKCFVNALTGTEMMEWLLTLQGTTRWHRLA